MSAPSPPSSQTPSREMIHEALRGWPAVHAYVLPDDQPTPPPVASGGDSQ